MLRWLRFLVCPLLAAFSCFGQTAVWDGGSGNWFGASGTSNWFCIVGGFPVSCGPPNGSGWTANIGNATGTGPITGTVTVNAPVNLSHGISLGNGSPGNLQISSALNTVSSNTINIGFQGSGTSSLSVQSGGLVTSSNTFIGATSGSSGQATVSGSGSSWNNSGTFLIGDNGTGMLTIDSGGAVTGAQPRLGAMAGSSGTVTVTGTGSNWTNSGNLYVGFAGAGTLDIVNGGAVNDTGLTIMGDNAGGHGTALISGSGSTLDSTGELLVSNLSSGQMSILNGGSVTSGSCTVLSCTSTAAADIGSKTGVSGSAIVSGAGSTWTNYGNLHVGNAGSGTLTITEGAQVTSTLNTSLGDTGGYGALTISGTGSLLSASRQLLVGNGGQGNLTISNGATVVDPIARVGNESGAVGQVLVDDATWNTSGALQIGVGGSGTVTLKNGAVLSAGTLEVGSGGTLIDDPSTITVNGDLLLDSGGMLYLDIFGTAPASFSQLAISGMGTFDGTVVLDFGGGFAPTAGDSFDLIHAGAGVDLSGASFEVAGLYPGFQYSTTTGGGDVSITALNDGVAAPEPCESLVAGVILALLARKREKDRWAAK